VVVNDKPVKIRNSNQALQLGIAYVTEDRRALGLTMPMSIATNISLPTLGKYMNRLWLVKRGAEDEAAEQFRRRLSIRASSIQVQVSKLSGGNQQKVLLSKWLNAQPQVLILDEPTRGIDVGAKAEVHHIINDLAAQGLGIIMISSDLPEIMAMSDRILVMREGRQMRIFARNDATQENVLAAMMGQEEPLGVAT
jgi:rhamnose transport system ATP-binding protein